MSLDELAASIQAQLPQQQQHTHELKRQHAAFKSRLKWLEKRPQTFQAGGMTGRGSVQVRELAQKLVRSERSKDISPAQQYPSQLRNAACLHPNPCISIYWCRTQL